MSHSSEPVIPGSSPDEPFAEERAAFDTYLRSEKHLSPRTQQSYARDLAKFCAYCQSHNITRFDQITTQSVRQNLAQLHRTGLSGKSLRRDRKSTRLNSSHVA